MSKLSLLLLAFPCMLSAQPKEPLHYDIPKTTKTIKIDAVIDDAWANAPWSADFVDIEGDKQPLPPFRTRLKMLWDDKYLYVLAELEEPHIWASLSKHDTIVFMDNDFELFIDPNNDGNQYFEIEVNARNTLFELFMNKPYNKGGHMDSSWNADGLLSAVHLNGTLNQPNDRDKNWLVEMAIPFRSLERPGRVHQPKAGDSWRINFSRVQWDLDVVDGQYRKRTGPNGKRLPEHNWVWSPQGVINMHIPEKWGYITFKPAK